MGRVGYTRNAPRPNIGILAEYTVNFDRVSRNRRVAKGGDFDRPSAYQGESLSGA